MRKSKAPAKGCASPGRGLTQRVARGSSPKMTSRRLGVGPCATAKALDRGGFPRRPCPHGHSSHSVLRPPVSAAAFGRYWGGALVVQDLSHHNAYAARRQRLQILPGGRGRFNPPLSRMPGAGERSRESCGSRRATMYHTVAGFTGKRPRKTPDLGAWLAFLISAPSRWRASTDPGRLRALARSSHAADTRLTAR